MPLVNVCFFALLLIPALGKRPKSPMEKLAFAVAAVMLGLNLWWWLK